MAVTRDIIDAYYHSSDISYKQQQKNIIEKIYHLNKNFFDLTTEKMHDLLIDQLKLDKFNTMNITLSAMTHLYDFAVVFDPEYVPYNIFKDEHLSRIVMSADITKNMLLITEDILERVFAQISDNQEFIQAANMLFYEGVAANWSDLLNLTWPDVSQFFWTVKKTPVSRRMIELLKYIREHQVWYSKKVHDYLPMTMLSEEHLFGYVAGKEDSLTEQQRRKNCSMFIRRNFILYYEGHKLEAQNLYYSGITNKIIGKYGRDLFIEQILQTRSLYQLEALIEEFGLQEEPGRLKKNLIPYAYMVRENQ